MYKRQAQLPRRLHAGLILNGALDGQAARQIRHVEAGIVGIPQGCLLYTSDAADERSSVDLGGRRIIKKTKNKKKKKAAERIKESSVYSEKNAVL